VKPEHNYRVVQDHNPVKQATLHLARERFEKDLAVKNQLQDAVMDYHFNKIESDRRQCEQERHAKKQKQQRFKQTLEEQIDGNVSIFFSNFFVNLSFLINFRPNSDERKQYSRGSQSPPASGLKKATTRTQPCGRRNRSNSKS
jgi:hypothetical protein